MEESVLGETKRKGERERKKLIDGGGELRSPFLILMKWSLRNSLQMIAKNERVPKRGKEMEKGRESERERRKED